MKPINAQERKVVNIHDTNVFTAYSDVGVDAPGTSYIKLNPHTKRDVGFYIYRMAPGAQSTPHRHGGAEEFFIIEGEVTDNDGTVYKAGDVVWLAPGTEHTSHTVNGCVIAVYSEAEESPPGQDA